MTPRQRHPLRPLPPPLARWPLRLVLSCALLAGCGGPERRWPFPRVDSSNDDVVVETLRKRVAGVRTLYGVLGMSFELPERSGVADAVVRYLSPGTLRMSAYKDLLVTSRDVFDLCITPERFDIRIETDDGTDRQSGPVEDLVRLYPGFRALGSLREAMFLPGLCDPGTTPRITRRDGRIYVNTLAPGNTVIEYELDPTTLGVRSTRLSLRGASMTVEYMSYREVEGRYLPERFDLRDPEMHVQILGVIREIELNSDLGPEEFQIDA